MIWSILYSSLCLFSLADVPAGPFYREDCTVSKMEQDGTTCDTCTNGMSGFDTADPNPEHCAVKFEDSDYTYVCSTNGASYWEEVWCDGPPKESACGGCYSVAGMTGLAPLSLVVLLCLQRRKEQ